MRVLVVDDSPVDRKVVELLLRNHNHQGGAAPFHGQRLLLLSSSLAPLSSGPFRSVWPLHSSPLLVSTTLLGGPCTLIRDYGYA